MPVADVPPPLPEPIAACVQMAAERYGVPDLLIRSVLHHESRSCTNTVGRPNSDGSVDLGCMQINTRWWLEELEPYGIDKKVLAHQACPNIAVGAWILRKFYLRHNAWDRALAAYNAGHSEERLAIGAPYARKIILTWRALYDLESGTYVAAD